MNAGALFQKTEFIVPNMRVTLLNYFIFSASVINLKPQMGQENDIYCHFSIRFHQNCIVRNTKQSGSWGREERDGGMPMSKGQAFHMIIAVHQDCFKVFIVLSYPSGS